MMKIIRRIHPASLVGSILAFALVATVLPAQAWTFKTLYQFTDRADGYLLNGELLHDQATGDLYGTTAGGGDLNCGSVGCGIIFKLSSGGQLTVLHVFSMPEEGLVPEGGLVNDDSGNLYGTTVAGGIAGCLNNQAGC